MSVLSRILGRGWLWPARSPSQEEPADEPAEPENTVEMPRRPKVEDLPEEGHCEWFVNGIKVKLEDDAEEKVKEEEADEAEEEMKEEEEDEAEEERNDIKEEEDDMERFSDSGFEGWIKDEDEKQECGEAECYFPVGESCFPPRDAVAGAEYDEYFQNVHEYRKRSRSWSSDVWSPSPDAFANDVPQGVVNDASNWAEGKMVSTVGLAQLQRIGKFD
ncbi:hypothetical protein HK104_007563 [Borealophlyctis nickersoniae]|nr:hypothetical protein HK104_007563 [Borealophlyctis nickersoniae]